MELAVWIIAISQIILSVVTIILLIAVITMVITIIKVAKNLEGKVNHLTDEIEKYIGTFNKRISKIVEVFKGFSIVSFLSHLLGGKKKKSRKEEKLKYNKL